MTTIVKRSVKGSDLTPAEADQNLENLNNDKLEKGLYSTNNSIVIKNNSGVIQELIIPVSRILGRKASGEIVPLTASEVKTLLSIEAADVSGLSSLLSSKSDTGHGHSVGEILGPPNGGWLKTPDGVSNKNNFDPDTVTVGELAKFVTAMYDALLNKSILSV